MSHKLNIIVPLSVVLGLTLFVAYAHPHIFRTLSSTQQTGEPLQTLATDLKNDVGLGDIAGQPEAINLSRRIGGERFKSKTPPVLILQGVLSTGSDKQNVQISRARSATGERVEVSLASTPGTIMWDATAGAGGSTGVLNLNDRSLLERLTFDSADQFILAQLRGASYYVVARNVRPDDAPENYSGPLWTVVRIDDPATDAQKEPLSRWRLYYLNSNTGLIDKVVSEYQSRRIEASFSDWTKRGDELSPSTITWTSNGQTLMTFTVTNVSLTAQAAQ